MTNYSTQIAEESQNRIAGAIKQFDTDDVLSDEQVEDMAAGMADMFGRYCGRFSVEVQESLAGGADDTEESDDE